MVMVMMMMMMVFKGKKNKKDFFWVPTNQKVKGGFFLLNDYVLT